MKRFTFIKSILTIGDSIGRLNPYKELMRFTPAPEMVRIVSYDLFLNERTLNDNCIYSIQVLSEYGKLLRENGYVNWE